MGGMMNESPKFASLSSGLLARKGAARPAMRRPSATASLNPAQNPMEHDDLGWNDMGHDADDGYVPHPANPLLAAIPEVTPEVRRQQEEIAAKLSVAMEGAIAPEPMPAAVPEAVITDALAPAPADADAIIRPVVREMKIRERRERKTRVKRKEKAAFTLRVDAERHLKLRLACAVHHVSAQKLIIQALDELLESMPELEPLAARVQDV